MVDKSLRGDWEVPSYQIKFDEGVHHDRCVVIPVINEGERIARLLERMMELDIAVYADIIIIDGGSTDGSLDQAFLRTLGVNALLVKVGSGRLSAQLRCAYAFALDHGYRWFVTIDGNNKDDPASIPAFFSKLEEGCDFVQASRFLPGGLGINTPLARSLAIRYIHAPLLRICSGFPWTDTTQGFRGYSADLLRSRQTAIFRDKFLDYELLAYLSYMAPRAGFRCKELPTTRSYPSKGQMPTKIRGLGGNWRVLWTLLKVCTGQFNPRCSESERV